MSCRENEALIQGYLDGELDLVSALGFEAHLETCETCAQSYGNYKVLSRALRDGRLYYEPPAGLEQRIRAAAVEPDAPARRRPAAIARPAWWKAPGLSWAFLSAAAALAAFVLIAVPLVRWGRQRSPEQLAANEVLSSHVRSLMPGHLTDVLSSDQHTVKPWFNGRLDFSPPVVDLAGRGFPLIGGRLDYVNDRPVAALVYQRRQHVINVFIWPSGGERSNADATARQGYNLLRWTQSGMTHWAVSDLNGKELGEFVRLLEERAAGKGSP